MNRKTKLVPEDAFGRVIRERRLALGLTQADLEGDGGLERSYISRLEAGQYQVCLRGILHLAHALKMTSAELMKEVENRLQGIEGSTAEIQPSADQFPKNPDFSADINDGPDSDGQRPDAENLYEERVAGEGPDDKNADGEGREGEKPDDLPLEG